METILKTETIEEVSGLVSTNLNTNFNCSGSSDIVLLQIKTIPKLAPFIMSNFTSTVLSVLCSQLNIKLVKMHGTFRFLNILMLPKAPTTLGNGLGFCSSLINRILRNIYI